MMFHTAILFLLPILVTSSEIQEHYANVPISDIIRAVKRTCQRKAGATLEDLKLFHDLLHLKDTRESKCMAACVAETYGILDDKGTISMATVELFLRAEFKPPFFKRAMEIATECYGKVADGSHADHCEFSYVLFQCVIDQVNKEKIEKVDFWSES